MRLLVILMVFGVTTLIAHPGGLSERGAKAPGAVLRGSVEQIEIDPDNSTSKSGITRVYLTLKLSITNNGKTPLIFLRREPDCDQVVIAKTVGGLDLNKREFLAFSGATSSEVTSKKWAALRGRLNRRAPPPKEMRLLAPGQSLDFDGWMRLTLPNDPEKDLSYPYKSQSLNRLRELSPLLLQVKCEVWPLRLERLGAKRQELPLGRQLQRRWTHSGRLWLDDIYSEPITINFKTASQSKTAGSNQLFHTFPASSVECIAGDYILTRYVSGGWKVNLVEDLFFSSKLITLKENGVLYAAEQIQFMDSATPQKWHEIQLLVKEFKKEFRTREAAIEAIESERLGDFIRGLSRGLIEFPKERSQVYRKKSDKIPQP